MSKDIPGCVILGRVVLLMMQPPEDGNRPGGYPRTCNLEGAICPTKCEVFILGLVLYEILVGVMGPANPSSQA
jgi:hypothetical protein